MKSWRMKSWNRWFASFVLAVVVVPTSMAAPSDAPTDEVVVTKAAKIVDIKITGANEDPIPENPLGPTVRNFRANLLRLRQIAADEDVAGVRLKLSGSPDFARTIDLVDELRRLKAAGKKVVCYTESLDQRSLVFASLADLLAMPPSGMVALEGMTIEAMYLKDLFAMLDIRFEVIHIGNFKTAYEDMARDTMSDEQRKVLGILLDEFYAQIQTTIAENRGIERSKVEAAYDKLLFDPEDAKQFGLIDAVAYEDAFEERVEEMFGGKVEFDEKYGDRSVEDIEKMLESPFAMFSLLPKLLNPPKPKLKDEPRIAIVYASGPIMSGKSQRGLDGSVSSMGSETIVEALEEALEDDWVRAVILRVNSPGGSALASDMIWRATQRVKAKKPIIASMGGVAGSGGYWISMGCDRIIAQPSTITGSIGVVGMLPDVSQALKRFGVNVQVVSKGPHGEDLAILQKGPTPFLKETIRQSMLDVYDEFITKVSTGRRMNPQVLETLARGRVWTGRQAVDLNLVDEIGGLERSIEVACELGGGLDPKTVTIAELPTPPTFMEALEDAFGDMITVEGQVKRIATELGYGDLVQIAESLLEKRGSVGAHNIQAVMPFQLLFR